MWLAGYNHVLAIDEDGNLWSWGLNNYGQLGDNTTVNKVRPVKISGVKDVVKIATGEQHSLALTKDGKVYGFGRNNYGQVGDSTTTNRSIPTLVKGLVNVKDIKANGYHNIALNYDGEIYTWGYNGYGQLGIGNTLDKMAPTPVQNVEGIKAIDIGRYYTLALKEDGTVLSFGYNGNGELGNGTKTNSSIPVNVTAGVGVGVEGDVQQTGEELRNVKAIGTAQYHSYAILTDNTMVSWGYNAYSQLGNGNAVSQTRAVKAGLVSAPSDYLSDVMMATGTYYGGALVKNDGTVWTIGRNNYGQIGDLTTTNKNVFVCISNVRVISAQNPIKLIVGGDSYKIEASTAVDFNLLYNEIPNTTYEFESKNTYVATVNEQGVVTPVKKGKTEIVITNNETGKKALIPVYVLSEGDKVFPKVSAYWTHTVALKADGTVWAWGQNNYGQLGDGTTIDKKYPVFTGITDAIDVVAGGGFTLVLKADGEVLAFGDNAYGKLGIGTTASTIVPTAVKSSDGTGTLSRIKQISATLNFAMALDEDGTVWSWGLNNYGQLGNGTKTNSSIPVKVKNLTNVVKICAGNAATDGRGTGYAIKDNGTAWAWGHGGCGNIGNGSTANQSLPVQIAVVSKVVDIASNGWSMVYITTEDGSTYTCGCGNGMTDVAGHVPTPGKMKGEDGGRMKDIAYIAAGNNFGIGVKKDNTAIAWGTGTSGQLSNGTASNLSTPAVVKNNAGTVMTDIILATAGNNYSVLVKDDGTVWTTGANNVGQLGDNTTTARNLAASISFSYIEMNETEVTLKNAGSTFDLQAHVSPGFNLLYNTVDQNIQYSSVNPNIATVDGQGKITAQHNGITAIVVKDTISGLSRMVTVKVLNESDVTFPNVVSGTNHTIGLKSNGTIWTWGANASGQLGDGTTTQKSEPLPINVQITDENGITSDVKFKEIACRKCI